jgi:hypothetical protein
MSGCAGARTGCIKKGDPEMIKSVFVYWYLQLPIEIARDDTPSQKTLNSLIYTHRLRGSKDGVHQKERFSRQGQPGTRS